MKLLLTAPSEELDKDSALPSAAEIEAAVKRREDRGSVFYRIIWRDNKTEKRVEKSFAAKSRGEEVAKKAAIDHLRMVIHSGEGRLRKSRTDSL